MATFHLPQGSFLLSFCFFNLNSFMLFVLVDDWVVTITMLLVVHFLKFFIDLTCVVCSKLIRSEFRFLFVF